MGGQDTTAEDGRIQEGHAPTKNSGRGVSSASPPFVASTAQVRLRGRTTNSRYTPEDGAQTAGRSTEGQPSYCVLLTHSVAVASLLRHRGTATPRIAGVGRAPTPCHPGTPSLHVSPPGTERDDLSRPLPCRRWHPVVGAKAIYRRRDGMARKKCDHYPPAYCCN